MTGGEHDGGIIQQVDSLCAEFTGGERLYHKERAEFEINAKLLRNVLILSKDTGSLLRNQDVLDTHFLLSSLHYNNTAVAIKAPVGRISSPQRYKKVSKGLQDKDKICDFRTKNTK